MPVADVPRLAALVLALAGCGTATPRPEREPGPLPPEARAEHAALDRGTGLEHAEEWEAALAHYQRLIDDPASGTRLRIRARVRAARCAEALDRSAEAVAWYRAVLADPAVTPDPGMPTTYGGAPYPFRAEAEAGLAGCAGDPVGEYLDLLRTGTPAQAAVAVISLARIGDPRGGAALTALATDAAAPAELRELAADELATTYARATAPK